MASGRREGEKQTMTSNRSESEPITPEFRTEVVAKFCRDFASGAVVFDVDPERWSEEAIDARVKITGAVGKAVQDYSSPETTPEQRTKLEPELYEYILMARGHGIVKDVFNKSKLEEDIESIEARFEAIRKLQMELLVVMREVVPKLEAIERKVDRLGT